MGVNCLKARERLRGGSLLFTTMFPESPGTDLIHLRRMKGCVDLAATQWFWTQDPVDSKHNTSRHSADILLLSFWQILASLEKLLYNRPAPNEMDIKRRSKSAMLGYSWNILSECGTKIVSFLMMMLLILWTGAKFYSEQAGENWTLQPIPHHYSLI